MGLKRHTLTLMRHAKSDWSDDSLSDHDRPLNARGERDAPEMGKRLKALGIRPSLLLTSTATRALETCKHVATAIGFPIEFVHRERSLYLAAPTDMLNALSNEDPAFHHIVIFAHNPGISELANQLSNGLVGHMPTGAYIALEANAPDWRSFAHANIGVIGYDYPKNPNGPIKRL
ncbi:MAG: histidine phosphatase family protein [Pseudomonadota bacterium]